MSHLAMFPFVPRVYIAQGHHSEFRYIHTAPEARGWHKPEYERAFILWSRTSKWIPKRRHWHMEPSTGQEVYSFLVLGNQQEEMYFSMNRKKNSLPQKWMIAKPVRKGWNRQWGKKAGCPKDSRDGWKVMDQHKCCDHPSQTSQSLIIGVLPSPLAEGCACNVQSSPSGRKWR